MRQRLKKMKKIRILYGEGGMELNVPSSTAVLEGHDVPAIANFDEAVQKALGSPIGSPSLKELLRVKKPSTVAITISDITWPVHTRAYYYNYLRIFYA